MSRSCDTRARLLEAALDLIWSHSYGSVGVEQICERAGVNKGSFYHFFASKSDLALEAYEEHWRRQRPEYDAIFSPQVPPVERLVRWCRCILEGQHGRFEKTRHVCGCPYVNIGSELGTQDDRLRAKAAELMDRGLRYLESTLAEAHRDGILPGNDPRKEARLVACAVTGLMVEAKVRNDPQILRDLEPMVLRLVGAPETA